MDKEIKVNKIDRVLILLNGKRDELSVKYSIDMPKDVKRIRHQILLLDELIEKVMNIDDN